MRKQWSFWASSPVTFIVAGGPATFVTTANFGATAADTAHLLVIARSLQADWMVARHGYDKRQQLDVWAVFNVSAAAVKVTEWRLPPPVRRFTAPTRDPAVMYALSKVCA